MYGNILSLHMMLFKTKSMYINSLNSHSLSLLSLISPFFLSSVLLGRTYAHCYGMRGDCKRPAEMAKRG